MKRSAIYRSISVFDGIVAVLCALKGSAMCFLLGFYACLLWYISDYWQREEDKQGE